MKVYIVTIKRYEWTEIAGVFSTREMADKYIAIHDCNNDKLGYWDYDDYKVEEHEIDSCQLYTDEELWYIYTIKIGKKFIVEEIRPILSQFIKEKDYITYHNKEKYLIVYSKTKDLGIGEINDRYIKVMANEVLE